MTSGSSMLAMMHSLPPQPARDRGFRRLYETNDGLLDITLASDLVTVSWCRFARHDKTMLIGGSDRHAARGGVPGSRGRGRGLGLGASGMVKFGVVNSLR